MFYNIPFVLARIKLQFRARNSAISRINITLLGANQIARITIGFKMDVIKAGRQLNGLRSSVVNSLLLRL